MAGAGYKLFNTGDVLTAAQVNTYLQEQTVMVFASAAARTTALSGVLAEGMMSYLTDTDLIQYYNGTAWTTVNTDQTPLTTKGDLFTYSTTDARLAVGNNGETLVADSSTSTGLRWQGSQAAGRNFIINGGMDIWQRGTSFSLAASAPTTYLADRWCATTAANQTTTVSRQATGDTTNLPFLQYALRYQRNSGSTGTAGNYLSCSLETVNSIPLAGRTVTFSFYARAGANYSPTSSALGFGVYYGTGTDQNFQGTYTGITAVATSTATLTTTWQRFTVTGTVASSATELAVYFLYTPTGTASTNDYYEITGVQLEVGSVATQFSKAGGNIAGELAACQRYYWRTSTTQNYPFIALGGAASTTAYNGWCIFPAPMRIVPTVIEYSTLQLVTYAGSAFTISAITLGGSVGSTTSIELNVTSSGMTAGTAYVLRGNNSSSAYLVTNPIPDWIRKPHW